VASLLRHFAHQLSHFVLRSLSRQIRMRDDASAAPGIDGCWDSPDLRLFHRCNDFLDQKLWTLRQTTN